MLSGFVRVVVCRLNLGGHTAAAAYIREQIKVRQDGVHSA